MGSIWRRPCHDSNEDRQMDEANPRRMDDCREQNDEG